MTPPHGHGSPGDRSQEHGPTDPPTVPIPLPQRRRTPRLRTLRLTLRHPRPARPSTVWPCAQDDLREGTGLLVNWLLTAVIKIVTTYTQPGQRVLLLDPAHYLAPPASWSPTGSRTQSRPGPYAGLHEAGWTVVRLGRSVQTQTAVAHPDAVDERLGDALAGSESGPDCAPTVRPPTSPPGRRHTTVPDRTRPRPASVRTATTSSSPRANRAPSTGSGQPTGPVY
ncbi:hypothetical protein FB471_4846 [Amycolatopsis cihanbeyliensis]|uniref:Uncharacterized protein n=1 Tax=Amycolatopsis cihanbeyliensis TaxID=1128664 RepID=A0A542DPP7_AMYCI|nr:hypothetical protein FB471_4846 [Amycolatopsis cihanbeyliensis]